MSVRIIRHRIEVAAASAWTPASFGSNLVAWWDFSDAGSITESGGAVSQVDDLSGNGYHLTQATGANKPQWGSRTLNGLDCLDFTPTQYMTSPTMTYPTSALTWTIFGALNLDAYGNWGMPSSGLVNKNRGNLDFLDITGSTVLATGTTYRVQASYDDTPFPVSPRNWLFVNGSADGSGAFGGSAFLSTFVVSGSGDTMDGRWGEIFIVGTAESSAHAPADSYLSSKWGTS